MGVTVREKIKGCGVWYVFIRHNGKRISRKIGEKGKVEEVANKIKAKILLGEFSIAGPGKKQQAPTFKNVSVEWMENYVSTLSDSTQQRYSGLLSQYITPHIGDTPINEISRIKLLLLLEKIIKKDYPPLVLQ